MADLSEELQGWLAGTRQRPRRENAGKPKRHGYLLKAPQDARFSEIPGACKGSHRKCLHPKFPGTVTVSGKVGDDAMRYPEKQIAQAIDEVQK